MPKPDGDACANDGECDNGNCSPDGVCCNEACTGTCESCLGADTCGADGTCAPIAAGTDPYGECSSGLCYGGTCQTGAIAFVTSGIYTGNLGGLAGADAICQGLATAACLPGTYMAWLSTPTESPSTRFTQQSVPYLLVNGTQLADDWADLTDGSLAAVFDRDEWGAPAPTTTAACSNPHVSWSATDFDGTYWEEPTTPTDAHCTGWTSTTGDGSWGNHDTTNNLWSLGCYGNVGSGLCSRQTALYCFEQ
jgi:hypothetical protein